MPKQQPNRGAFACALLMSGWLAFGHAAPAAARLLDVRASAFAGGVTGTGAAAGKRDFFQLVRGPAAGFELGLSVLLLDLSFNFAQVMRVGGYGRETGPGSGFFVGTLTQVLLGFRTEYEVGEAWYLQPRLQIGLAAGTRGAVEVPLENEDISHKGLVSQASLSLEHFLSPFVSLGLVGVAGYHRFLQGSMVLNDPKSWGSGYHLQFFTTVTAHLGL